MPFKQVSPEDHHGLAPASGLPLPVAVMAASARPEFKESVQ